jgi:uncharacterized membrane-anchored protein
MAIARRDENLTPITTTGPARVDRRTKHLVTRLTGGEVAIIDHADLDRAAAEGLLAGKVKAVVNASPCTTGRYPNLGPVLLARAGVVVVDQAGPGLLASVREGDVVTVRGGEILVGGSVVAEGVAQSLTSLEAARTLAKDRLGEELDRFAENTLEYLKRERHVMLERPAPPELGIDMRDRHVLVVVRGSSTEADLAELMPYIREMRPVLIGVDGGANALLKRGLTPDVIVGDFDSATAEVLRTGARLVVHAYPGGVAPGAGRLEEMGLEHICYESPGVSEDVAMLLAWEKGAELIVAVGTHASLDEFLDKGRAGMASTFLTRLLLGSVLVDAKGVSRLYATRVRKGDLAMFIGAAMLVLLVAVLFVPQTRVLIDAFRFVVVEKLRHRS